MRPRRRTPLILVVDDDPTTNCMLEHILAHAGFETACAFDAATAWTGISERRPDLVLLDVDLPDGSGFDVCRRLQAEPGAAQMPVMFISSNDEVAWKVKGFNSGGVDYIPKPIAADEVLARVTTHLRLKQAFESLVELQSEHIQHLALAQETLMPSPVDLPEAHFEVHLKQMLTAGGDFYDVISAGNQLVDYIVADASGHDLAASFWTAALKTLLSEYATATYSPQAIVRLINSALSRILPAGVFFTAIYARLNRRTGKLVLVNAGHPPAVVVRGKDQNVVVLRQDGDVIGAFADAVFEATEVPLSPGDRFFLYSDGLIESRGREENGLDRLVAACGAHQGSPLAAMVQSVVAELTRGALGQDDVLLLGVEV
jgi:phosphoserine phosphatase RsbU/P